MTGTTVFQYLILEKIGAGGKGVVYKAEDTRLKRLAALKFLSAQLLGDPESRERFLREAQAVAALNHPNIVTVYEINEWQGQLYIAMEYVAGQPLNAAGIREKETAGQTRSKPGEPPLPFRDLIEIALQIGAGLKHAHGAGIVHRDLKPQNIMVGPDGRVKLLDFGLAKILAADPLTKESTSPGTLNYMSPEQLRGEAVDATTDVWSLGTVLYEALSGRAPFLGENAEATIYSILFKDPAPFTRSDIPGLAGMETVVARALKKKREERYPNMDSMIADLQALGADTAQRPAAQPPLSVPAKFAIAVLPFDDLSPKQDEEYFCHGLAEDLINALARVEGLKVVASAPAFFPPRHSSDARAIGRKLQVQFILEGSVRKSKKKLRICARLLQVADGALLWSEKYDRVQEDIFAIQDEITMAIAGNLQAGILQAVKARQSRRYPQGTETYHLFLRGRYFLNKRYSGGLQRSTDFFRQCIALDGNYALAHVGMADAYNFLGLHGFMPPNDAFPLAKAAALKALALDDELGEAHASLGWTTCFYDWDQVAAESKYRQAIGLDPGYAAAREWYALFLAMMGRFDQALAEIAVGLELDPLSLIINSIGGLIHVFSRDYDSARKSLERTLELDPHFLLALIWLGESYTYTGMPDKAVELLERAVEVDPEMSYALAALGHAQARAGHAKKAQAVLERMEAMAQRRYVSRVQLAQVRAGLGDTERAFGLYDEALAQRDPFFLWFKVAPQFDGIRSDPRFRGFLEKTGLVR